MILGGGLPGKVSGSWNIITGCSVVWLARLIWDQEVAGSNPVTPILSPFKLMVFMVGIAQLVRAPDCGSGGRGFESHYPPFEFFCYHGSLAQ